MVLLYRAEVRIELKPGVADPEGANTKKALELLGFSGLKAVKSVHAFSLDLDAKNEAEARKTVEEMCKRLLVNPVIHVPRITVTNGAKGVAAKAKPALRKPAAAAKKATKKVAAKAAKTAKVAKKAVKKAAAKTAKKASKKTAGKTAKRGGR